MSAAQYRPGEVLSGTVYRVVRHLATGGMGSVYDVEDTSVEKRYVLKTLHPNLVSRDDLAMRMRDEAKSLAKLQHPNIVDVITAGVTTDSLRMPFYVMERLIGQNLRTVLEKKSALQLTHAYRIAIDVADALEHAHENNIVHRDVKPENIFLHRNANGTTTTKLLDFGIVRLLDRKVSHTHGRFVGTLRYAAPEQITGKTIGPTTDIYALGVVLFEMLSGRGPFDDVGDAYAIGAAHANAPAPPLSRFTRVDPSVERLVASALSKDPADRPRDCFVFASELRRILQEEEAIPRSVTLANVLTSGAPTHVASTPPVPVTVGEVTPSRGPTLHAIVEPQVAAALLTRKGGIRADAPVSPVESTLAVVGLGASAARVPEERPVVVAPAGTPNETVAIGNPGPVAAAATPVGVVGVGRAIDRSAPTRVSDPPPDKRRLAPNDTQMDMGLGNDDAIEAPLAEAAPFVASPVARRSIDTPSSPARGSSSTGSFSGHVRKRSSEKSVVIFVAVAAVVSVGMVVGAFVAVRTSSSVATPEGAFPKNTSASPLVLSSTEAPRTIETSSAPPTTASGAPLASSPARELDSAAASHVVRAAASPSAVPTGRPSRDPPISPGHTSARGEPSGDVAAAAVRKTTKPVKPASAPKVVTPGNAPSVDFDP